MELNGLLAMLSLIRRRLLESKRLPAGYQEVEYIKNNSTSGGLDTGIHIETVEQDWEVTFKADAIANTQQNVAGYDKSNGVDKASQSYVYLRVNPDSFQNQTYRVNNGTPPYVSTNGLLKSIRDTEQHTARIYFRLGGDNAYHRYAYFDGVSVSMSSAACYSVPYTEATYYLFNAVNSSFTLLGRIYNFKRYDTGGNIITNYVPCVRKSDDTPGFYDLVSGTFKTITNAKTKWEAGPIPGQELPYGVTGVEWLESTGTQYIDTGVIPTADTRFVVDGTFPNNEGTHGCFTTGSASCRFHLGNGGTKFHFGIGERFLWPTTPLIDVNRHVLEISGDGKAKIDNNTYTVSAGITNPSAKNIFLYANNANSITQYVIGKVYSSQIYESGVLVRDYTPVVKDNVGYMYDKVQQKLYANAGTGSFVAGPDV